MGITPTNGNHPNPPPTLTVNPPPTQQRGHVPPPPPRPGPEPSSKSAEDGQNGPAELRTESCASAAAPQVLADSDSRFADHWSAWPGSAAIFDHE